MSVETVHFTIGEDLGIRLMEISQEHLLYDADIDKALNVFNLSFGGGCPIDLQYDLLIGDKVITVDVEDQSFIVVDREQYHNAIYPPKINLKQFFAEKQKQLEQHCKDINIGLKNLIKDLKGDRFQMNFNALSIIEYIHGNDENIIKEIESNLASEKNYISLIKNFITKSLKFSQLAKRLKIRYPDIEFDIYDVVDLSKSMIAIRDLDFSFYDDDDNIDTYINAISENNEIITNGIEPVDIMDNYSAGWLSPQGDYYALNGDIANMLHNEIADALQTKGIIPKTDNNGDEINNPDSWLEQQGWVKIHDNNVQFAGCLNHKIGLDNVHMTDIQKKMIYEYCAILHGGIVKAGWRRLPVSAIRFRETDDLMLAKNYFNYD